MIGWIILGFTVLIFLVLSIICFIVSNADNVTEAFQCGISLLIFALTILIFVPANIHYQDTISIPQSYITINQKIKKVELIISNKQLNFADNNINQTLAELIKEKEDILLKVRINNMSPYALFKINLDK